MFIALSPKTMTTAIGKSNTLRRDKAAALWYTLREDVEGRIPAALLAGRGRLQTEGGLCKTFRNNRARRVAGLPGPWSSSFCWRLWQWSRFRRSEERRVGK